MLGAGALGRPREMVWGGRREEGSGWGTRVYLWQIHVDIWQNQYNIVKLKNKIYKKNWQSFGKSHKPSYLFILWISSQAQICSRGISLCFFVCSFLIFWTVGFSDSLKLDILVPFFLLVLPNLKIGFFHFGGLKNY